MNPTNTTTTTIITKTLDYQRIILIIIYLIIVINLFLILIRLFIWNCLKTDWFSVSSRSSSSAKQLKREIIQKYQKLYYQDSLVAIRPDTFFKKVEKYKEQLENAN